MVLCNLSFLRTGGGWTENRLCDIILSNSYMWEYYFVVGKIYWYNKKGENGVQKRTKRLWLFGVVLLGLGLAGFCLAVRYSLPLVGIIGAGAIINGVLQTLDYTILGIKETKSLNLLPALFIPILWFVGLTLFT